MRICDKSFDLGLFLSYASMCCLAGSGGLMAAAVSGAIVGGKPVVDVVKSLFKLNGSLAPYGLTVTCTVRVRRGVSGLRITIRRTVYRRPGPPGRRFRF
jgi:hypothetical protein